MMNKLIMTSLALGTVVGAYLYGQATSIAVPIERAITKTVEVLAPPPPKVEVSPIFIIKAMEEKFEVTTFSMNLTADDVKVGRCDGNWWQNFWWRDCLKMSVPGTINAGFGRDILDRRRFTVSDNVITVNLGTPKINPRVYINHARVTVKNPDDSPGKLADVDKNLQAKGFTQAEQKLRIAACRAGIQRAAALSAEKHYGDEVRNTLAAIGASHRVVIITALPTKC